MGAQFDGVIINNSNKKITNWKVELTVPEKSEIDSSWNGIYIKDNQKISITAPLEYNTSISSHSSITFGFIFYTTPSYEPTSFSIDYEVQSNITEYMFFWFMLFILFGFLVALITSIFLRMRIKVLKRAELKDKYFIDQTLRLFANTIEAKDEYTKGHSIRVSMYSKEIAKKMGLSHDDQMIVYYSALLHDVGRIGIPDHILNKPGKLTDEEMQIMKTHATKSAEILEDFAAIPNIAKTVKHHHERYDGNGYPSNLKGEEIPLFSRIICIADCFDAMTTNRCYKKQLSNEEVKKEFESCSGKQFDPTLVSFILEIINEPLYPLLTGIHNY